MRICTGKMMSFSWTSRYHTDAENYFSVALTVKVICLHVTLWKLCVFVHVVCVKSGSNTEEKIVDCTESAASRCFNKSDDSAACQPAAG